MLKINSGYLVCTVAGDNTYFSVVLRFFTSEMMDFRIDVYHKGDGSRAGILPPYT